MARGRQRRHRPAGGPRQLPGQRPGRQRGQLSARSPAGSSQPQGLNVKLVGKTGWFSDVGIYGRMGTLTNRSLLGAGPDTSTMGYGVGVSWDLSPRATASLGWDTYDVRGANDIRGTSLGLRWRY